MSVTKNQRQKVYDKSSGHCWYCGCDLPDRWHVDHVEPIYRYNDSPYGDGKTVISKPELHNLDNMVPACPPCNMFKSVSSIEGFRKRIEGLADVLREYSVKFRNAERFNMVQDMREPVTFWFEDNIEILNVQEKTK